ncbi:MAG: selenide, water dikinase SelD [Chloroflexi bacterium AL-W]|nr:selenide, water dikinase SelD [Chloroflexi bacterium AL-N1]NOK67264.1 selenide, water dikinase SelD [Chloroflexi bacterium AL-N10]NOK75242.1 selenide, water dikinase SelD [Chloroflexi bacterium AL-N5]NOK82030.1 selenide, water dikinase SelD [Chloroflexi bacterium AL-W]NOK89875.1 selenide, water dikinase SelD [Chloroflexi bacterium AL-N15]
MGPGTLAQVLRSLKLPSHPNLLIGLDIRDDAAVYRVADDQALVQTVDFFPPIVDDPYTFGAIAAANALSDVYAMGGKPILALAIAGFPENFPPHIISAILQGGADKVAEAGAVIAGGHTTVDAEPKYGLCVTGLVHPDRILTKAHAQPGDHLLLTKPLGTGIVSTAHKRGVVEEDHLTAATASMLRLNRKAAEIAIASNVAISGMTDITGYGLLGHAHELAHNSQVQLVIDLDRVPILPGTLTYARDGILPGGLNRNRDYLLANSFVSLDTALEVAHTYTLFDPQTSGGLLIAVPPASVSQFQAHLHAAQEPFWEIGKVREGAGIIIQ